MKVNNIGNYPNIPAFVSGKLDAFTSSGQSFRDLYAFMFSERDNILIERSVGYKIEKTTYGRCRERLERRASTLQSLLSGCAPDSLIGLCMENSVDWIELFWAILCCGHRPLLMNPRIGQDALNRMLEENDVKAVISDGPVFAVRTIPADDIAEAETPIPEGPMGSELIVMSSGTSSHVKLCAYSAKEIASQIRDSAEIIRHCRTAQIHYDGELKLLTFLPFYHIFGLVAVYIWFAFFSRTLVLLRDYSPQTILDTIRRHKVTHVFAVPLLWERIYDEAMKTIRERGEKTERSFQKGMALARFLPAAARKRLFREVRDNIFGDSVQFCITGGGMIRPETLRFFNGIGYWLSNGYGMSEVGITSVELSGSMSERCSGSIGQPLSSVEYRLRDGILQLRGSSTARRVRSDGVWKDRTEEWFSTGDLAEERDGRIHLLGRSDDLVIGPDGENLNPEILEPALTVPGVREIALISGKDRQPVVLASVPRWMDRQQLDDVRAGIAAHAAPLTPRIVMTADPLMEDGDFKISRARIREKLLRDEIRVFEPEERPEAGDDDPLLLQIRTLMAVSLGREEAVPAAADFFSDLGGSSLDYYALSAALEEEMGITLPREGEILRTAESVAKFAREETERGH